MNIKALLTLSVLPIMLAKCSATVDVSLYEPHEESSSSKKIVIHRSSIENYGSIYNDIYNFRDLLPWANDVDSKYISSFELEDGPVGINPASLVPDLRYSDSKDDINNLVYYFRDSKLYLAGPDDIMDGGTYQRIGITFKTGQVQSLYISNGTVFIDGYTFVITNDNGPYLKITEPKLYEDTKYFDIYDSVFSGSSMKGAELYCFSIDNSYYCVALPGTNRDKTPEEIAELQLTLPCPLAYIKRSIPQESLSSIVRLEYIPYPATEDWDTIDGQEKEGHLNWIRLYLGL